MNDTFNAVKVSEHVHWVGAIDWGVRDFHGYKTDRGSTYNAYLVTGDKNILIDTVKAPFKNEMLARIATVMKPQDIDYIISNHSEMDHSGCLLNVIDAVKPEKVFASVMGVKALADIFHSGREITAVKDGGSVKLGRFNFTFYETRMLHWPDSMFAYFAEDSLLFSQDAFGMHLATSERFADELGEPLLYEEGAKYFANILLPYSALVTNLLKKVQSLGLKFTIVAPDHGPIWRGNDIAKILGWYARWAEQKPTRKAVVAYGTMWQCTAAMAKAVAEGAADGGVDVKLMPLASHHRSDVATEILEAGALVVGSATLNNAMLPWVADALNYLKGLRPQNLVGQAFGSYGWSGEGVEQVGKVLDEMKVARVGDPIKTIQMPDAETLKRCRALGKLVAEKLKETCK